MKRKSLLVCFFIAAALLVSGCGGSTPPAIEITTPRDLSIVLLPPAGNPYDVGISPTSSTSTYFADHSAMKIDLYLSDNGRQVYHVTDTGDFGPTAALWFPTTLGDHILTAEVLYGDFPAQLHGDLYATSRICVVQDPANPIPGIPTGTTNICHEAEYPSSQSQPEIIGPTLTPTLGILHILPSITPSPTLDNLTILPTATFTPASALDCPSGTYFADVTHQCIAIATSTLSNGGENSCNLSAKICFPKKFDPATCSCK
jgi:hypothetical protein